MYPDRPSVCLWPQIQNFGPALLVALCINAVCEEAKLSVRIFAENLIALHCHLCALCREESACRYASWRQREGQFQFCIFAYRNTQEVRQLHALWLPVDLNGHVFCPLRDVQMQLQFSPYTAQGKLHPVFVRIVGLYIDVRLFCVEMSRQVSTNQIWPSSIRMLFAAALQSPSAPRMEQHHHAS